MAQNAHGASPARAARANQRIAATRRFDTVEKSIATSKAWSKGRAKEAMNDHGAKMRDRFRAMCVTSGVDVQGGPLPPAPQRSLGRSAQRSSVLVWRVVFVLLCLVSVPTVAVGKALATPGEEPPSVRVSQWVETQLSNLEQTDIVRAVWPWADRRDTE